MYMAKRLDEKFVRFVVDLQRRALLSSRTGPAKGCRLEACYCPAEVGAHVRFRS